MKTEYPPLERYLDEVSAHLGRVKGKRDFLLELEAAVLDRAEDIGEGSVDESSVRRAVEAMADPTEVALAYAGEKYLIGPRLYRTFMVYTALLFVIHLVMIIVASVTDTGITIFSVSVLRVADPQSLVNFVFVAAQAFLMDLGLMVVIFAGIGRVQRTVRIPNLSFRVATSVRHSATRAVLAVLVLLILNVFRDKLFIVVLEDRAVSMFSQTFLDRLPWINVLLVLVVAKETAYAFLGERRILVVADAVFSALAVALMIWFLTSPAFIAFPSGLNEASVALSTLNRLMQKLTELILIIFAVGFAIGGVKRVVRLWQIW